MGPWGGDGVMDSLNQSDQSYRPDFGLFEKRGLRE